MSEHEPLLYQLVRLKLRKLYKEDPKDVIEALEYCRSKLTGSTDVMAEKVREHIEILIEEFESLLPPEEPVPYIGRIPE